MLYTRSIVPLEDNNLRRFAPSIFADQPYEKMSGRYRFVKTIEVINLLRDHDFFPIKASQSRTRIEGKSDFTKHLIRLRHRDHLNLSNVGDEIPELVLVNSHDGKCGYQFHSGIFRLVCANGMIVSTSDFGSISVRHTGDTDFSDKVIDATFRIVDDAPKVTGQIATWKNIRLSDDRKLAFAESAVSLLDNDKIKPADVLRPRRVDDQKSDLWTTFNTVQENIMKGGITTYSEGRRNRTRPVKSIDKDLRLNKALWTLTAKMAELVS